MSYTDNMTNENDAGFRITGWHILGALVAFFGVIITVNVIFLYYAVTTFSGIETEDAYRKGVAYNARLEEARQLDRLGWQGRITATKEGRIEFTLLKDDGAPVRGVDVEGRIGRPSTDRFDADLVFTDIGSGRYVADKAGLAPGNWIVSLEASDPLDKTAPRFRIKERLWLSQ